LPGLGVGYSGDEDASQRRTAGCYRNQRHQQGLTVLQKAAIGESKPPGDGEGDEEESSNLVSFDPSGKFIHRILLQS